MKTLSKALLGVLVLSALLAVSGWWLMRPRLFVKRWVKEFAKCHMIEDVRCLPQSELIFVREFSDKTWCAARSEHSCATGAGFNATVFCDSQGRIYFNYDHHFCGYEGLAGELSRIAAQNADGFRAMIGNVTTESTH